MMAFAQVNDLPQTVTAQEEAGETVRADARRLLLRHRAGDAEAFAELVVEYRAPVYSYLARCGIQTEDRDDLFQEVFIRIHRAADSYDAERPLHPWIFTIVSNAVRTHVRKRRVRQLVFGDAGGDAGAALADPAPDGERRTAARETAAFVERQLRRLRLVQRQVVLLACVEKLPLKDVAAVLEIPVNTVKTHLRRARLALAGALAREQAPREVAT
jgi:RNA polymerase sigma-70 factor, ECF subfamily